jgi:acetyl esterase/lipase
MLSLARSLFCNPLLIGLGVLLLGVVLGYGDRVDHDLENDATLYVNMVRPDFQVPTEAQLIADLEYARPNGTPLLLDLYRPEEVTGPLPVILWIHGGGWREGHRGAPRSAVEFVARGYAVASIDYRLSDAALFPAQIDDCQAAVRWLRAHAEDYQLDPQRFVAWGEGSGGHLAALLGTMSGLPEDENDGVSADVQAVVDFGGPVDLLTLDKNVVDADAERFEDTWSPEALLLGGPVEERAELAARANPLTYLVGRYRPPAFFVVHNKVDPLVPVQQSDRLVRALREAGGAVRYLRLDGWQHNSPISRELEEAVAEFLDRRLSPQQLHKASHADRPRFGPSRPWYRRLHHGGPAM